MRLVAVVLMVALSGCSVAVQGKASLFQRERPASTAETLKADQNLLAALNWSLEAAEAALVSIDGVPRPEARKRVLDAYVAAKGGQ